MARSPGVKTRAQGGAPTRPMKPAGGLVSKPSAVTAAAVAEPKKKTSISQFLQEVRIEARKITWTSWKETWITSVMVGIMVVTTAIFFLVVDWGLGLLVQQILKLASA